MNKLSNLTINPTQSKISNLLNIIITIHGYGYYLDLSLLKTRPIK
jgi:hypothetical protein